MVRQPDSLTRGLRLGRKSALFDLGTQTTMTMVRAGPYLFLVALLVAGCGHDGSSSGGNPNGTFQSDCHVRFAMTTGELTSTFQSIFDYSRAPGHFVGVNTAVECTRLDDRAGIVGANQCTGPNGECLPQDRHELYVTAQTTRPISSPLELLDCRFIGSAPPAVEEFELVATYATDENLQPFEPPPGLEVTDIECQTVTTTTSTLPEADPCDSIDCADDEACADGACVATDRYLVEFRSDLAADYGSLQIDARYACAGGSFVGTGETVSCSTVPALNVFAAFHDHDECIAPDTEGRLAAGVISLVGWQGPAPYLTCEYTSRDGQPPTADTFRVDVVDATDLDGLQLDGATVSVSSIRPIAP